nr:MAG TPA: tail tube protein [Caudoviricetes sp.]
MLDTKLMKSGDAISASLAELFVTIDGQRYNIIQLIKFEAKFTKKKVEIPIMGKTGKGHKAAGWSGTGSATLHYNTSVFREAAQRYKETGEDVYYEAQLTNEDPSSSIGRQTVILKDLNFDELILAKADATADYLDEDMGFTFDDFEIPEKFNLVSGMV